MTTTTERTAKTLADIASDDGIFSIIAMDQRNTLRRMFVAAGLEGTVDQLRDSKVAVARALTPYASGILFDPTDGVPAATEAAALASTCGLLVAAEPAERGVFNGDPRTHRDPALNGQWVLDQGGDAVKFFVQLRADPMMRGRVLALQAIVFLGSTPIGGPIVGTLSERLGARYGLALGAIATLGAAAYGLLTVRRADALPLTEAESTAAAADVATDLGDGPVAVRPGTPQPAALSGVPTVAG